MYFHFLSCQADILKLLFTLTLDIQKKIVVVIGAMVSNNELAGIGFFGYLDCLLPAAVTPAFPGYQFRVCIVPFMY
jgi:hypothetical protein